MSRFIESIRVENRQFQNLKYHQARMDLTRKMCLGIPHQLNILEYLSMPDDLGEETYKCRIVYAERMERAEFAPYQPKPILTLKLIIDDTIGYAFKYEDRSQINRLFGMRGECDDILIVKGDLIRDTSYCNIIFFDGSNWLTPEMPLLKGTKRQQLLEEGKIASAGISVKHLKDFEKFMLINAMLDFDETRSQPIGGIRAWSS